MQNFGKIKNAFNGILAEGVVSKNISNKQLFKKYVNAIKESEILKTEFLIYNNLENKICNENTDPFFINLFINENLKLLEKYSVTDIENENKKLVEISKDIELKMNESYDSRLSELHESISKLICTKRTTNNIDEVADSMIKVSNYIKTNKPKEINEAIDLPPSMITTLMVDKYNEKYSNLDESDRKVLKSLINSSDEEKKNVYSSTVRECIDLIDDKLKTSNLDTKDKLLRVKDKLLNDKQEITEDYNTNISKLVELRTSLKN